MSTTSHGRSSRVPQFGGDLGDFERMCCRLGDFLMHYGVKGMHWGIRRTPEQLGHHKTPRQLSRSLQKIKYKEFTKLMSPKAVEKLKKGSCHDQVMYEMSELRKMGIKPKAKFLMECSDDGQGGMTHSFVYYKKGKKTCWLENAWSNRAGITEYNSINDIKKEIRKAHKTGEFGNKAKYKNLIFADFDDRKHRPGESLQELVDKCFRKRS